MKKLAIIISALIATSGLTFGGYTLYQRKLAPEVPLQNAPTAQVSANTKQSDPTTYDTFDIEFSKKLILYHQLAAQLDDYATTNATKPAVREFAAMQSSYNTEQANAYIEILKNWGEQYSTLQDFPKVAGGGCSGYPTFPGMLPHADVNSYLQTTAEQVDQTYLSLMTKHHGGINLIVKAEGSFINYGALISLRDAFYASQAAELTQMADLQKQYGYAT